MRLALNADLKLDEAEAAAESPALLRPIEGVRLTCWVGAGERGEFIRQNALLANIWTGLGALTRVVEEADRHHFSIIDGLTDPDASDDARTAGGLAQSTLLASRVSKRDRASKCRDRSLCSCRGRTGRRPSCAINRSTSVRCSKNRSTASSGTIARRRQNSMPKTCSTSSRSRPIARAASKAATLFSRSCSRCGNWQDSGT